jgi:hypothetical protein
MRGPCTCGNRCRRFDHMRCTVLALSVSWVEEPTIASRWGPFPLAAQKAAGRQMLRLAVCVSSTMQ